MSRVSPELKLARTGPREHRPGPRPVATSLGAFYLVMAGINIGITIENSSSYRHFADAGLFSFVRTGWMDIVMAQPTAWIGLLAAGQIAIGSAFIVQRKLLRPAYVAAICFHLALMVFGWGVWAWAVPALAFLVFAARHDLSSQGSPHAISRQRFGSSS